MHRVYARHVRVLQGDRLSVALIKRCIRGGLLLEGVDFPCELSVLITDDVGIRDINRRFRDVDEVTDVLSFPMQEFDSPGWAGVADEAFDTQSGFLLLGDIVLSADRVSRQAKENGNTLDQETAYLTVHSLLHLLGYDHIDEGTDKAFMREREETILRMLGARN